jgi:hypothetical protein
VGSGPAPASPRASGRLSVRRPAPASGCARPSAQLSPRLSARPGARAGLLRAALVAALLAAASGAARAQEPDAGNVPVAKLPGGTVIALPGGTVVRPHGPQYGYREEGDPPRLVVVVLDGVEVVQGPRTLKADTLVLVLATERTAPGDAATGAAPGDAPADASPALPSDRYFVPDSRLLELYMDGNVTVQEGAESITGASAFHLDNATGVATIVRGELRSVTHSGETLVARYDLLRRLQDGTSVLEGLTYTNCAHALPHWHIETPEARLTPTPEGRILTTSGNTVRWGDVPLLWWPGLDLNIDRDRLLLHRVRIGSSSRFGTEVRTRWGADGSALATGVAGLLGYEGEVHAEWEVDLNLYSKRGLFTQPEVHYWTDDSYGTVFGSYINDSEDEDHLDQPIEDNNRGRFDLEHRTQLDEHRTLDVEVSAISDENYLSEYYDNEFREGKEQETYVSYREVVDNHAWGVLARTRLNDFQTQVEYLPEVTRRRTGDALGDVVFGDAFLTMRDFISNARLLPDDDTADPSESVLRAGNTAEIAWPFDLENNDRVQVQVGQDITGFSDSVDSGAEARYAANAGGTWSRTWVGTGEARNERWNIDGLRRIVELRAGYFNRFALSTDPEELIQIDEVEQLDRNEVFTVSVRDRIQTHQDGGVATLLDTEVSLPLYPDPDSDNDPDEDGNGDTLGFLQLDTRWVPHANITGLHDAVVRWRATIDLEDEHYDESYTSFATSLGEGRRLVLGTSSVRHEFSFVTATVQWALNPKWTVAVFLEQDTRTNDKVRNGFLLRQKAHCWYIDLEVSNRRADTFTGEEEDETRVSLSLSPIGSTDEDLTSDIESRIF